MIYICIFNYVGDFYSTHGYTNYTGGLKLTPLNTKIMGSQILPIDSAFLGAQAPSAVLWPLPLIW